MAKQQQRQIHKNNRKSERIVLRGMNQRIAGSTRTTTTTLSIKSNEASTNVQEDKASKNNEMEEVQPRGSCMSERQRRALKELEYDFGSKSHEMKIAVQVCQNWEARVSSATLSSPEATSPAFTRSQLKRILSKNQSNQEEKFTNDNEQNDEKKSIVGGSSIDDEDEAKATKVKTIKKFCNKKDSANHLRSTRKKFTAKLNQQHRNTKQTNIHHTTKMKQHNKIYTSTNPNSKIRISKHRRHMLRRLIKGIERQIDEQNAADVVTIQTAQATRSKRRDNSESALAVFKISPKSAPQDQPRKLSKRLIEKRKRNANNDSNESFTRNKKSKVNNNKVVDHSPPSKNKIGVNPVLANKISKPQIQSPSSAMTTRPKSSKQDKEAGQKANDSSSTESNKSRQNADDHATKSQNGRRLTNLSINVAYLKSRVSGRPLRPPNRFLEFANYRLIRSKGKNVNQFATTVSDLSSTDAEEMNSQIIVSATPTRTTRSNSLKQNKEVDQKQDGTSSIENGGHSTISFNVSDACMRPRPRPRTRASVAAVLESRVLGRTRCPSKRLLESTDDQQKRSTTKNINQIAIVVPNSLSISGGKKNAHKRYPKSQLTTRSMSSKQNKICTHEQIDSSINQDGKPPKIYRKKSDGCSIESENRRVTRASVAVKTNTNKTLNAAISRQDDCVQQRRSTRTKNVVSTNLGSRVSLRSHRPSKRLLESTYARLARTIKKCKEKFAENANYDCPDEDKPHQSQPKAAATAELKLRTSRRTRRPSQRLLEALGTKKANAFVKSSRGKVTKPNRSTEVKTAAAVVEQVGVVVVPNLKRGAQRGEIAKKGQCKSLTTANKRIYYPRFSKNNQVKANVACLEGTDNATNVQKKSDRKPQARQLQEIGLPIRVSPRLLSKKQQPQVEIRKSTLTVGTNFVSDEAENSIGSNRSDDDDDDDSDDDDDDDSDDDDDDDDGSDREEGNKEDVESSSSSTSQDSIEEVNNDKVVPPRRSRIDRNKIVLRGTATSFYRRLDELFFSNDESDESDGDSSHEDDDDDDHNSNNDSTNSVIFVKQFLTMSGRKIDLKLVCATPRIFVIDNFLTSSEIQHFESKIKSCKFQPSFVDNTDFDGNSDDNVKPGSKKAKKSLTLTDKDHRTSSFLSFSKLQDSKVAALERRAAELLGCWVHQIEALQLVRYLPGEFFGIHHDLGDYIMESNEVTLPRKIYASKRRLVTIFVYLNTLSEEDGGCTFFPNCNNLRVKPKQGTAVLWSNITSTGEPDSRTIHAGEAVNPNKNDAVKYGINIWVCEE